MQTYFHKFICHFQEKENKRESLKFRKVTLCLVFHVALHFMFLHEYISVQINY